MNLGKIFRTSTKLHVLRPRPTMAKSKLITALAAHKGRDYRLEKQKKLQKEAAKKKRSKAPLSDPEEKENVQAEVNGTTPMPEGESEGWESDESEVADATAVCQGRPPEVMPSADLAYRSILHVCLTAKATATAA